MDNTKSSLASYSTDALLYELLRLTRREQWEADPLRFGCEAFPEHFSKPPAPMHRAILEAVTGGAVRRPGADGTLGVGELPPTIHPSLPYSPPVSPAYPEHPTSVQPMTTT